AAGRVVNRAKHVASFADVVDGEGVENLFGGFSARRERGDVGVVRRALRERFLEDRRIGRHADDSLLGDQLLQPAAADDVARELVAPDRDAEVLETEQGVSGIAHFFTSETGSAPLDASASMLRTLASRRS